MLLERVYEFHPRFGCSIRAMRFGRKRAAEEVPQPVPGEPIVLELSGEIDSKYESTREYASIRVNVKDGPYHTESVNLKVAPGLLDRVRVGGHVEVTVKLDTIVPRGEGILTQLFGEPTHGETRA